MVSNMPMTIGRASFLEQMFCSSKATTSLSSQSNRTDGRTVKTAWQRRLSFLLGEESFSDRFPNPQCLSFLNWPLLIFIYQETYQWNLGFAWGLGCSFSVTQVRFLWYHGGTWEGVRNWRTFPFCHRTTQYLINVFSDPYLCNSTEKTNNRYNLSSMENIAHQMPALFAKSSE